MAFVTSLLDLILAPVCLACDERILACDTVRFVCGRCRSRLRAIPSPACPRCGASRRATGRTAGDTCPECDAWPEVLACARSACLLHPPADALVHQLKYNGWRCLAGALAERMARVQVPAPFARDALCIAVPTSAQRLRERGYNQAGLLATAYARLTGRECLPALERSAASASQTGLQPVRRRANVAGAFRPVAAHSRRLANAHVILIDDVLTTGATAVECSHTLERAGVRSVMLITFARALDARRLTSQPDGAL